MSQKIPEREDDDSTEYGDEEPPIRLYITMLDVAQARGVREESDGTIIGDEFARVGVPLLGGCEGCHATLGVYNAFPDKSGYWRCADCLGEGFETVEDFEASVREG